MDIKTSIFAFAMVLVAAIITPIAGTVGTSTDKPTPVVQTVELVKTNALPIIVTNQMDRGNSNVDWFKQSSTYIWDGWKIK